MELHQLSLTVFAGGCNNFVAIKTQLQGAYISNGSKVVINVMKSGKKIKSDQ